MLKIWGYIENLNLNLSFKNMKLVIYLKLILRYRI